MSFVRQKEMVAVGLDRNREILIAGKDERGDQRTEVLVGRHLLVRRPKDGQRRRRQPLQRPARVVPKEVGLPLASEVPSSRIDR